MPHNGPPGLGPLVDGDAPGDGPGDFRVAVVNGGGTDHQVAVPQVVGIVAHGHGDAQGAEALDRPALRHVGALDDEPLVPQDLRQGAHGDAPDAHQVGPHAGDKEITDGFFILHHGISFLSRKRNLKKIVSSQAFYYNIEITEMQRRRETSG